MQKKKIKIVDKIKNLVFKDILFESHDLILEKLSILNYDVSKIP